LWEHNFALPRDTNTDALRRRITPMHHANTQGCYAPMSAHRAGVIAKTTASRQWNAGIAIKKVIGCKGEADHKKKCV
jgi:hypothetical protein